MVKNLLLQSRGLSRNLLHVVVAGLSLVVAFLLRFDLSIPGSEVSLLYRGLILLVPVKAAVFFALKLDKDWARRISIADLGRTFWTNLLASGAFALLAVVTIGPGFPRSIYLIDFLICLTTTSGICVAKDAYRTARSDGSLEISGTAVRLLSDTLIVMTSLAVGLLGRFSIDLAASGASPSGLVGLYLRYYFQGLPLLVTAILLTFTVAGVYTKKRSYSHRYKFIAIAQATSISYGLFLLVGYLSWNTEKFFVPRSAFLVSYVLTMIGCTGARFLAYSVSTKFHIQPKKLPVSWKVRKVLVIGGAGYIGSVLVRQLLDAQYEVRVLDKLLFGDESIRDLIGRPGFELLHGDFRHVDAVVNGVRGVDAVIHLGAIVGDPACALDEQTTLQTNYAATALVTEVCKGSGVSRLVFASTCSVYGATDHLVDEKSDLNPVSLYAATKIDAERILLASKTEHFHPVVLRLGTAFGLSPRPRFDLVVNLLTAKAYFDRKIAVYNGEQWRPFVHVSDISRAFRLMLEAPLPLITGEIFNVGSYSMNHRLRDVSAAIRQIASNVDVVHEANSDVRNYRVSFDKIHSVLGFECQTSLLDGIMGMHQALEKRCFADYTSTVYHNHKLLNDKILQVEPVPLALAAEKFSTSNLSEKRFRTAVAR